MEEGFFPYYDEFNNRVVPEHQIALRSYYDRLRFENQQYQSEGPFFREVPVDLPYYANFSAPQPVSQDPPRTSVTIHKEHNLSSLIEHGSGRINKDLLHYFVLPDVFPNDNERLHVSVASAIFRKDRRQKMAPSGKSSFGELHASLMDDQANVMILCHSCTSKPIDGIFMVRSVERRGADLIVAASVNCSGNPTSSSRNLRVYFEIIGYGGNPNLSWTGFSTTFRVYHSRKRILDDNAPKDVLPKESSPPSGKLELEKAIIPQDISQQHRLLKAAKAPVALMRDFAHPTVVELYPHLMEYLAADSTTNMSECAAHLSFLACGKNMHTTPLLDTSGPVFRYLIPHFMEFAMSISDICRIAVEESTPKHEEAFNFHIQRLTEISGAMLTEHPTEWTEMCRLHFIGTLNVPNFEWCYCDTCMYGFLALVVDDARKAGMTKPRIAEMLNDANVPTKQRKKWHSSLTSLRNKQKMFVMESPKMPPHWRSLMNLSNAVLPMGRIINGYRKLCQTFFYNPRLSTGIDIEFMKLFMGAFGIEYHTVFNIEHNQQQ